MGAHVGCLLAVGEVVGANVDGAALGIVGADVKNTRSNVGDGVSTLAPCPMGAALGDSEVLGTSEEVGTGDALGCALGLNNGTRVGTGD